MEDLGHLIETLLEAEATSACFDDVVHVLKGWLTSAKEWERERALRVFTHVLGARKERCELMVSRDPPRALVPHSHHSWPWKGALPGWVLGFGAPGITGQPFCLPFCLVAAQGAGWAVEASGRWGCLQPFSCCCPLQRGCPYKQFGSLVGLLGSLTSDCLATCRQRAWVCLGYLLQMQAKSMKVPQADEIWCLCEELNSPDTETLAETCTEITKAVCRCIPAAQAVDFLTAILGSLLRVMPPCARAVWQWVFVFLVECRKEIVQEVPKILNTLYSYMQQSTHRPFLLHAVFLLTHFHQEPVISSLLQESLLMDSDTVELWRSLGRSILGIRILRCLVEKLNRAGNDRPGTDSSTCERHDRQTALETLTITCAISEVVLALRSTEELSWGQLYLKCQMHVEKPCRVFLSTLELVLGKCMAQKWMQLLVRAPGMHLANSCRAVPREMAAGTLPACPGSRRELKNIVCMGANLSGPQDDRDLRVRQALEESLRNTWPQPAPWSELKLIKRHRKGSLQLRHSPCASRHADFSMRRQGVTGLLHVGNLNEAKLSLAEIRTGGQTGCPHSALRDSPLASQDPQDFTWSAVQMPGLRHLQGKVEHAVGGMGRLLLRNPLDSSPTQQSLCSQGCGVQGMRHLLGSWTSRRREVRVSSNVLHNNVAKSTCPGVPLFVRW
ncbi:maestro heat-like repeat-containing protein family member 2B [Morphnus guianensis]